jgi:hypothetical protein
MTAGPTDVIQRAGHIGAGRDLVRPRGEIAMLGYRRIGALALAVSAAVGSVGCEPPPRLQLTVDSTAAGVDDNPGDGVCSSAAAGGA